MNKERYAPSFLNPSRRLKFAAAVFGLLSQTTTAIGGGGGGGCGGGGGSTSSSVTADSFFSDTLHNLSGAMDGIISPLPFSGGSCLVTEPQCLGSTTTWIKVAFTYPTLVNTVWIVNNEETGYE